MLWFYILVFIASCFLLIVAGKWLVDALAKICVFLKMKEFVLAFFIVAFGTTLPNLIIGVISAVNKIPELSFGDVIGANIFDLSIVMGIAALVSRGGLASHSRTVKGSSVFTLIISLLPLLLIFDGVLSRVDGILLLLSFAVYVSWLFSKKDRFSKTFDDSKDPECPPAILKTSLLILICIILLLVGGQGIVKAATFFYQQFNFPLGLMGLFVVAIGTCLPEAFFSLHAARSGHDWMILGNIMGNIAFTSTFILGTVSLITPIVLIDFRPFVIARIFLIIAAMSFFIFLRSSHKITRAEGMFLILIYIVFVASTIISR